MLADVRRCIVRVPRDVLEDRLPHVLSAVVGNPASDYQAYRRLAELLDQLHFDRLRAELVEAAGRSSDPDVREVAEDFGA
jgi:hypothetical protein